MTPAEISARAGDRCEYCRMHQALQGGSFHVEHVIPRSRGGSDAADNLAWACPGCNLRKSNHSDAVDPTTKTRVVLFHPRLDRWSDHFSWTGTTLRPLTRTARATAALMDLNHPRRLLIREAEALFGLFPPPEPPA